MNEFEINNRLHDIQSYIASKYFRPEQAKTLYKEREELEKMLEALKNEAQVNP